jgi:hypothetical protein
MTLRMRKGGTNPLDAEFQIGKGLERSGVQDDAGAR